MASRGFALNHKRYLYKRVLKRLGNRQQVHVHELRKEFGEGVSWILTELKRAGFVINPDRGYWRITNHGYSHFAFDHEDSDFEKDWTIWRIEREIENSNGERWN